MMVIIAHPARSEYILIDRVIYKLLKKRNPMFAQLATILLTLHGYELPLIAFHLSFKIHKMTLLRFQKQKIPNRRVVESKKRLF